MILPVILQHKARHHIILTHPPCNQRNKETSHTAGQGSHDAAEEPYLGLEAKQQGDEDALLTDKKVKHNSVLCIYGWAHIVATPIPEWLSFAH